MILDARIRLASPSDANELSRLNQEFSRDTWQPIVLKGRIVEKAGSVWKT
jgi:hypothetical protein